MPSDEGSRAAAAIEILDLRRDFDADLLARAYEEILRPSFDVDELEPLAAISEALRTETQPRTLAALAVLRELPIGILIAEHYRDSRVLLLAYVAVRPSDRGRGVGARLLSEVGTAWWRQCDALLALGEVHDPRHWGTREGPDAWRRLAIYDRLGARILAMPFVQPALREDKRRVHHLLLLAFAVRPGIETAGAATPCIEPGPVEAFIREYYTIAEGRVPLPGDPEFDRIRPFLAAPIPLLPIADLDRVPGGTGRSGPRFDPGTPEPGPGRGYRRADGVPHS